MRWLLALLAMLLPTLALATSGPTDGLPQPGECALWAGQARLLARRLLERAVQAEKPELARFYIETAYQLSPAPQLLYNLGLLSLRSGQSVEAADLLLRYADLMGPKLPGEHKSAVSEAERSIAPAHCPLRLATSDGAFVFVDDRLVGQAPLKTPLRLSFALHRLRIELGYRQIETKISEPPPREGSDEIPTLTLRLPQALVVLAPELGAAQQKRLTAVLSDQGFSLVPSRDRDLLLQQVPDRTGCLTQTGCQLWIGEQLDVEQILVVRSLDFLGDGSSPKHSSRLSMEVLTVPQGSPRFRRQTLCPDCSPTRIEPYLQALLRTLRRELPDLIGESAQPGDEPAPIGFGETPGRLSPCALARGTARRLARKLLVDASQLGNASEARGRLETAYQLSPSPLLLYNLGLLYRRQGQPVVAADLLARFLATADTELTSERRSKAESAMAELTGPSAQLDLRGPASAQVTVDGRLHGAMPLQTPILLAPGSHVIVVESGYRTAQQELTVQAMENRTLTMNLPEATLILPDEQATSRTPSLSAVARRTAEENGRIVIPDKDRELFLQSAPEYAGCAASLLCMRRVGKMLGAQSVIGLLRTPRGDFAARLLDVGDSAMASAQSSECRSCDSDEKSIRHVVHKLLSRQHGGRGEPLLDSKPQATLWLDGFPIGSPPQKLRLIEGTYQLEARLSPSQRLSTILRVPIDTHLTLGFVDPPTLRSRKKLAIGATLLAVGTALVATGIGVTSDAGRRPPPEHNEDAKMPPGFIAGPLLLVGGAASTVAGGLVLGLRSR